MKVEFTRNVTTADKWLVITPYRSLNIVEVIPVETEDRLKEIKYINAKYHINYYHVEEINR